MSEDSNDETTTATREVHIAYDGVGARGDAVMTTDSNATPNYCENCDEDPCECPFSVQPNGATAGPSLPDWTEEERTRAAWGDLLKLDPNGAPYSLALLSSVTERLTASVPGSPTATSSPTTPEPRVDCKRCDDTGIVVTGPCAKLYPVPCPEGCPVPAPQVPDSPGWWWLGEADKRRAVEVYVPRGGHPSVMLVSDTRGGLRNVPTYHISETWGGRCTRGAPASDDEAVTRECHRFAAVVLRRLLKHPPLEPRDVELAAAEHEAIAG